MRYSIEPRDGIYVKGYRFISFARSRVINMERSLLIQLKNLLRVQ